MIWKDYDKNPPPKFVVFIADFGEYQEKMILDRKGLWSEQSKTYSKEKPNKWKINTKWDILKLPRKKTHLDVKTLLKNKGQKVNKVITWKSYKS